MVQRLWLWLVLAVLVSVGCQHTAVADDDVEDDDDMEDDDDSLEDDDHPLCQSFSSDECTETDVKTHCPSLCEHPLCKFYSSDECTETDVKTYCPSLCDSTPPTSNATAFPNHPVGLYGVPFNGPDRLVVGGQIADPNEYPWMALLLTSAGNLCGGALISKRHVLTAAHCFDKYKKEDVTVRLGEYNRDRVQDEIDYSISKLVIHDDYIKGLFPPFRNDVAVVRINRSFFALNNAAILPICIPPLRFNYFGETAIISGWGLVDKTNYPQTLQELNVTIWSTFSCNAEDLYNGNINSELELCARAPLGSGACSADSGSPLTRLIYDDQRHMYRSAVVGILSWGFFERCGSRFPDVYMRVDAYLEWISKTVDSWELCNF